MKKLSIAVVPLVFFLVCPGASATGKIDINIATLNDLTKIIHIGEKRAQELISLRPFSSLDDLAKIKGIGPARIEDIKKQGIAYVETLPGGTNEPSESEELITETATKNTFLAAEPEASPGSKIDVNAASLSDLQLLVGIGAVLAQRIIELRPFYSLDELTKVNGIGTATLENIKNQGLAWVDPKLVPPKAEDSNLFDKGSAAASLPLQRAKDKEPPIPLLLFLFALVLSAFSGATILALKKKLESFS